MEDFMQTNNPSSYQTLPDFYPLMLAIAGVKTVPSPWFSSTGQAFVE